MKLWSKRYSVARGWHWKFERAVSIDTAEAWLRIFRNDEPGVEFKVAQTRPR